ncbi:Triose-phosphate isomerase [Adhaeribacter pallidiroseus]|uniref:Triosephosphate isomerase n=1 Tax=Adhaeribacter pallidiroseus TaxID=2072847 RepID=A0A369QQ16_9BACT|nr:Triose-phosphate isomerase [Adhaeribacter pallidiroseus]
MRKKIVAGNWKMNKTQEEGLALVSEITNMVQDEANNAAIVVVCPPFPFLAAIGKALGGNEKVKLGAQNCHQNESGAYTGEVSAAMLKSVGVEYVILGHSERRQYFQEDNQLLELKVKAALKIILNPSFAWANR